MLFVAHVVQIKSNLFYLFYSPYNKIEIHRYFIILIQKYHNFYLYD